MRTFDDETMILDVFKEVETEEICCLGNEDNIDKVFKLIKEINISKNWKNSSSKSDFPPDFYNTKHKVMVEVMRIDDCAYLDDRGNIQNKTLQREGKIKKELVGNLGNVDVHIIAYTGLSTNEDHNFKRYCDNFKRVFNKHESKLDTYKRNHPGYKTIFFIFDESTAYMQIEDEKGIESIKKGDFVSAQPHVFCFDKYFFDIIKNSKVDYVIWFAPYKMIKYLENNEIKLFPLPKCAIYEISTIQDTSIVYNDKMIKSVEE